LRKKVRMPIIFMLDEIEFKNAKWSPFGHSQEEIWYEGERVGLIVSDKIKVGEPRYYSKIMDNGDGKTVKVYFEDDDS
jgi:hypothetical protein